MMFHGEFVDQQNPKRSDHQPSKKTRTTTRVLKHKNNLKSRAVRINPYARPAQLSQRTRGSKKDNSVYQKKRPLPILPGKQYSFEFVAAAEQKALKTHLYRASLNLRKIYSRIPFRRTPVYNCVYCFKLKFSTFSPVFENILLQFEANPVQISLRRFYSAPTINSKLDHGDNEAGQYHWPTQSSLPDQLSEHTNIHISNVPTFVFRLGSCDVSLQIQVVTKLEEL